MTWSLAPVVLLASGACVGPAVETATSGTSPPTTSALVDEPTGALEVGEGVITSRGNAVAVLQVGSSGDGDDARVDVLVEACARGEEEPDAGIRPSFFLLVLDDRGAVEPATPGDARRPALRSQRLVADTCVVGWLAYEPPEGRQATHVVFGSRSSAVAWAVDVDP